MKMWLKETRAECCVEHEPLPDLIKCFTPDICVELRNLYYLHNQAFIKNKRISNLARSKPRKSMQRFVPRCPCHLRTPIEIVHLDQIARTRTEQLAYPKARKLLLFKEQVREIFPKERIMNLNRLIRKSLFSLYSRLANALPLLEIKPIHKWDKSEWDTHTKKLKRLAKHKVALPQPRIPKNAMLLSQMRRYKYLAKPKKCELMLRSFWMLTPAMKHHVASERTRLLAKAIVRDTSMLYTDLPIQIPATALKTKASKRTMELAQPNARRTAQATTSDLKENPFAISPNALKTKASKRTKDLAEPKEYENKHIREDPYAISKSALTAKAKPRTIELAKPKKV